MNTTLLLIIGVIIASWLIALCFIDFRGRCVDYLPEIFSDLYQIYREDDTNKILYKAFLVLFVFLVAYPTIILLIIISPILWGLEEIWNLINDCRNKCKRKDEPLTDWQIRQQERERNQKEMKNGETTISKHFTTKVKLLFILIVIPICI